MKSRTMALTPNPTAESAAAPRRVESWWPSPNAEVDVAVIGSMGTRNALVGSAVPEPAHVIAQMNPASWISLESRAGLEVSGCGGNAGYIRDSSTGTGFSASRVPGSLKRVVELRSRTPIGALAAPYNQGDRRREQPA